MIKISKRNLLKLLDEHDIHRILHSFSLCRFNDYMLLDFADFTLEGELCKELERETELELKRIRETSIYDVPRREVFEKLLMKDKYRRLRMQMVEYDGIIYVLRQDKAKLIMKNGR